MNASRLGRRFVTSAAILGLTVASLTAGWRLAVIAGSPSAGLTLSSSSRRQAEAPSPQLSPAEVVATGRDQFTRLRHTEPTDPKAAAHRMFNARSCAECHHQGGLGGAGPKENNVRLVSPEATAFNPLLSRVLGVTGKLAVLPRRSLAPEYEAWLDEHLIGGRLRFEEFLSVGAVAERNTPPLFGLGLLESIPQSEIDAVAAAQPREIRGRSRRLPDGSHGRFGWKANTATLSAFNENACAVELGLTTPRFLPTSVRSVDLLFDPGATPGTALGGAAASHRSIRAIFRHLMALPAPPQTPTDADAITDPARASPLDMSEADVAALTRYVASLPPPRQVVDPAKRKQVAEGERHFHAIGCADCHTPSLGGVTGLYSDLLLHRVGTTGGGFYGGRPPTTTPTGDDADFVDADLFRTPPLWGVADSAPYFNDGSAATLEQAIVRHGLQAGAASAAYQSRLSEDQRQTVIAFLESLRAPQ